MFSFKKFTVDDSLCAMKVGTDGVLLGSWTDVSGVRSILDIGTGSGLIALMMAQRVPDATIVGVEIEEGACVNAMSNVAGSPWADRIHVIHSDISAFDPRSSFPRSSSSGLSSPRLIVSNPPFFTESLHSPDPTRSLARHGEDFGVKSLIEYAAPLIVDPGDSLAFIAPSDRDDEIEFILALNKLTVWRHTLVCSKEGKSPYRSLWQVVRDDISNRRLTENSYLCIRNRDNTFSVDYVNLTSDFYLDK